MQIEEDGSIKEVESVSILSKSFTVEEGTGNRINFRLALPNSVRPGQIANAYLMYANVGNNDSKAPLTIVKSTPEIGFRILEDKAKWSGIIQLLAISSTGPPGIIRPGQIETLPLILDIPSTLRSPITLSVFLPEDDGSSLDALELIRSVVSNIDLDPWPILINDLTDKLVTWPIYHDILVEHSTELGKLGHYTHSVRQILFDYLSLEFSEAIEQQSSKSSLEYSYPDADIWLDPKNGNYDCWTDPYAILYKRHLTEVTVGFYAAGMPTAGDHLTHCLINDTSPIYHEAGTWPSVAASRHPNFIQLNDEVKSYLEEHQLNALAAQTPPGSLYSVQQPFAIDYNRAFSFYAGGIFDAAVRDLAFAFGGIDDWSAKAVTGVIQRQNNQNCNDGAFYSISVNYFFSDLYDFHFSQDFIMVFDQMGLYLQQHGCASIFRTAVSTTKSFGGYLDLSDSPCAPDIPPPPTGPEDEPEEKQTLPVVFSADPNEKLAPLGFGSQNFVGSEQIVPYAVNFENVPKATSPATEVRIVDALDPRLDWRSFRLGKIGFGDVTINIPENRSYYQERLELGSQYNNMLLDVDAGIDILTGQVHWYFVTIDPKTGEIPENPLLGFLPPNDDNGIGQGYVVFSIKPKAGLATGTEITNKATIVFDSNEPIETNKVSNTIDGVAPSSAVNPLTPLSVSTDLLLTWTSEDDTQGSGVARYDLYVSNNGGTYELWKAGTTATSAVFTGEPGHHYRFYSIAKDNAGNIEASPQTSDAETTIANFAPSNPSPADAAADVAIDVQLSWEEGYNAATHDLYLWKQGDSKPATPTASALSGTTYSPASLDYDTTYQWQVAAHGSNGETAGPVWSFTTMSPENNAPYEPSAPTPSDGASEVSAKSNFSWQGGDPDSSDSVTYDIFLDTVNPPLTKVSNSNPDTHYLSEVLGFSLTYFWQVVAKDRAGMETQGPVWTFTTFAAEDDQDQDGLTNEQEIQHSTDPFDSDSDDDGMKDGWEVANNLNPLLDDASDDADGDGYTNGEEYLYGTDPQDKNSKPIWKVDSEVPLSGDGAHWESAFKTLQEAVDWAREGDEIWVKAGTYALSQPLEVNKAVAVYGGFAGTEEDREARNWSVNLTRLDGQLSAQCLAISGDAHIDGLLFTRCQGNFGGAVWINAGSSTMVNSRFIANQATDGGAIYATGAQLQLINCEFANNQAVSGGAIAADGAGVAIAGCTFAGNSAAFGGAILSDSGATVTIVNSILWGDAPDEIDNAGGTVTATYSDIEVAGGYPGTGNMAEDPRFVDGKNGLLRLRPTSPCIDAGTAPGADAPELDLAGQPRIADGDKDSTAIIDMGAYEYQMSAGIDSCGVYRRLNGLIYLKKENSTGFADASLCYGIAEDIPVAGDWDGDGVDGIGVYRNGQFYLKNTIETGYADMVFAFGQDGDKPVAGDWDGDGIDTIGVYRHGLFLLRNSNDSGPAEMSFLLGIPNDVPLAGNWDGIGGDSCGVFRPSNGLIFLKNENTSGYADVAITFGIENDLPVMGDWDGDGVDTIGVYRNGAFLLRNSNQTGWAEMMFWLGTDGDVPISGKWGLP